MIEALLTSYGLEIEETVIDQARFYTIRRNGEVLMNTTRNDLLVTGLLLVIADLTQENNRLLKQIQTQYDVYR